MSRYLNRLIDAKTRRRWRQAADAADRADPADLRQQRQAARLLRADLDRLIHAAEEHLARPGAGNAAFPRPHGTDWAWRPRLWCRPLAVPGLSSAQNGAGLGGDVTLFHDCAASELTLRQLRNMRKEALAPYGLRMDVFRFTGSFLSLALDLPEAALADLGSDHLLRVETVIEPETPLDIYARLNINHGPNTERLTRLLPLGDETARVDFDISELRINENRIGKIWLDLIFDAPEMNQVILRDLTFARHRRAAI